MRTPPQKNDIIPGGTIHAFLQRKLFCAGRLQRWTLLALAFTSMTLSVGIISAKPLTFFENEPIQQEIDRIKATLGTLPIMVTHASPWTLGYAASWDDPPEAPLTIEIAFAEPAEIDLVAMLPATYTDPFNVKQSFGFPVRFALERLLPDGTVEMIANHLHEDYPEPGMGPQLFPCPNAALTEGLRITVTRRAPNPTWWSTSHVVALSELFAFVGERNAALHGKVTTSSSYKLQGAWAPDYLTDGFSLYSQIDHKLSDPTKSFHAFADEVRLEMDLGKDHQIDEFRLWPVVRAVQHNYPMMIGVGFPRSFRLELASKSDFSDAAVLHEENQLNRQPGGGPWMKHVAPSSGRYLRITLKDGIRDFQYEDRAVIMLAEIEFLEKGVVVSSGLPVLAADESLEINNLSLLSDGFVNEGKILPLRKWLTQFHQRISLSLKQKVLWPIATEARMRDQKRATLMLFIAIGVIVALAQMVWLVRVIGHRRWARMRERIACDLHDEIGANVSSIAHTAELLKETLQQPSETQTRLLDNLIDNAHLTTRETKHFVRFIESEEQDLDLTQQFAQVTNRILGTIPVSFSLENTRSFNALDPRTKWNLLLFYKEALNNIIKHSGATHVEIHTKRTSSSLLLEITDNGCGMPEGSASCRHLESRAKVLGGLLDLRSRPTEGTSVKLTFNRIHKS